MLFRSLHSAFLPPHPQPQPCSAATAVFSTVAAFISEARVRSLACNFALPPDDMASRRSNEALRLTTAGVAAIFPVGLMLAVKLDDGAAACGATGATAFGRISADGRAGVLLAFAISAALPVVDIALRLSRTNSRAVFVVAGCAIVNPNCI